MRHYRAFILLVYAMIVYLLAILEKLTEPPPIPKLRATWWGAGSQRNDDISVEPFAIHISDEVIRDLHDRLNRTLPFQQSLEFSRQHYGINSNLLDTVLDYWKTKYNWTEREQFLNQFPQFKTEIQGLNIHFLHVKSNKVPKNVEVLPLLLLHGWPGSVREFYEILPILTTPQPGRNFVFEVIAPSLPGYGFSDAATRSGLGPPEIARIFDTLMRRLGFRRYYIQGGDWGSLIATDMAILYRSHVKAIHLNMCYVLTPISHLKVIISAYWNSLVAYPDEFSLVYPLSEKYSHLMLETGYMHLQATKPDTVGVALRDSPAGLAAWILEKFVTWTNPTFKNFEQGGNITKKFSLDKLLDNIMIYWVTKSITTSMRLYSEQFTSAHFSSRFELIPVQVPSGCSRFKHEIAHVPRDCLYDKYWNLVQVVDHDDGGHFAAFELPEILAEDVFNFVEKVRQLPTRIDKKTRKNKKQK